MQTTSHFIWIELKAELFSDIFVKVFNYIKKNNILNSVLFQNPLSMHITLYYLEKNIDLETKKEIKEYIKTFDIRNIIKLNWFNYFSNWEWNKSLLYFTTKTKLFLEDYRNKIHMKYNRNYIEDNNLNFFPHITFMKIEDSKIFEKHRENIENIVNKEIKKVNGLDLNTRKIFIYAVNSRFKKEIQVKI
jgi:2'-5' RNA ligase